MSGWKTISRTDPERLRNGGDFVWDGQDEDERPLTREEMRAGIEAYKACSPERPKARVTKTRITIRLSPEVVERFRATGPGWQTRMDEALKDWLKQHPQGG